MELSVGLSGLRSRWGRPRRLALGHGHRARRSGWAGRLPASGLSAPVHALHASW